MNEENVKFALCDFRGTDTLTMELLKCCSKNVVIYHVGERPRYLPDKFRTNVGEWTILGGFENDEQRDSEALMKCTHYLAIDFNSDSKRKSGTQKNIELCESLGKLRLT